MDKDDRARIIVMLEEEIAVQTRALARITDPKKKAEHAELVEISRENLEELLK